MKPKLILTIVSVLVLSLISGAAASPGARPAGSQMLAAPEAPAAVGTSFTYQGRLAVNGQPANGKYDFRFYLCDAASGGCLVGGASVWNDVADLDVTNGLFTAPVNFGAGRFDGSPRWIEVGVRPYTETGSFTILANRQPVNPAPYAMYSGNADMLDAQDSAYYRNASNLNAGTLGTGYYSAYGDLGAEGYLGNASGDLALNNGALQANLNSDKLDGLSSTNFLQTTGGTLSGGLTINATLESYYGGGRAAGGDNYTNRFWVGSLPYCTSGAFQKLLVHVWGGSWSNLDMGEDVYAISSRASGSCTTDTTGLKITRTRLYGSTSRHVLSIYDNGTDFDVVVEVINQSFPTLLIRSFSHEGSTGYRELNVTGGFTPSGALVPVAVQNQIMLDSSGNVGIGTSSPAAKLDVDGVSRANIVQIDGGADLAEPFVIIGESEIVPGMVTAIDPDYPGQLRLASQPYDRMVSGCISGAGGLQAGLVMHNGAQPEAHSYPVALSGRVYCLADASYGAIHPGDLLTTSATPGHAMLVQNYDQSQGAILGKAMSSLEEGLGLVLILVTLH
jgi:hypothetical protein